jgi:2-oxoglutarate ferredoxin oxidoreductase subunit alpha
VGVIAWGSTFGSALEAVLNARQKGRKAGALKVTSLFPFHETVIRGFAERCKAVLIPELNYEGQLANLIGHLCGQHVIRLNRATGVPLSPTQIFQKIEEILRS